MIIDKLDEIDPSYSEISNEIDLQHQQLIRLGRDLRDEARKLNSLGSNRLARLKVKLQKYVALFYEHMHLEEGELLAPALEVLSNKDWQQIDNQIAAIQDPVFSQHAQDEYRYLLNAYLSSTSTVSMGRISSKPLLKLLEIQEKNLHRLFLLRRLPVKVLKTVSRRWQEQLTNLAGLVSDNNRTGVLETWENLTITGLRAPSDYWSLVTEVVQPGGKNRRPHPKSDVYQAKISLAATTMNVVTRVATKSMMKRHGDKHLTRLRKLIEKRDKTAKDARITSHHQADLNADWVEHHSVSTESDRVILYLPGGAFRVPAAPAHFSLCAELSKRCQSKVLLTHYRLAPEHAFPAALLDALAAYKHLLKSGFDPKNIVVSGDSAGGGLSLSLLLKLRDEGYPLPAAVGLMSPATDLSFTLPSRKDNRWSDPMLPAKYRNWRLAQYPGNHSTKNPYLSPVFADLEGLPPMMMQVGSTEILLDDSVLVAEQARAKAGHAEVEVWDHMPHVWQLMSFLPEAAEALDHLSGFFNRFFQRSQLTATEGAL